VSDVHNLKINNDYEITKEYRLKYEEQCDCAYCRNYYKTFKAKYPHTAELLESLGLDSDYPLETMPFQYDERSNEREYLAFYPVKGTIDQDEIRVPLEGLEIHVFNGSPDDNPCPNPQMDEPYLLISISGIKLPWVVDENPD
jgi:hypothetical protein